MGEAIRMKAEQVKTLAAGSIGASYTAIGDPTTHAIRILLFQNLTDATLMFSIDGTRDTFPLSANSYFVLDIATNKTATSDELYYPAGSIIFVKRIGTPTTGSVYVTAFYGK